jgi:hypothetical protein
MSRVWVANWIYWPLFIYFFYFLTFIRYSYSVEVLRVIGPSQGLYLNTGQQKHSITHTLKTSMPEVGFELTITASERAKTVHALERSASNHLRIVNTSNYDSLIKLHTTNITVTTAHINSSVFTRRFLVTDFNTVCLSPYSLELAPQLQQLN